MHARESPFALKRMLVEMWTLKVILVSVKRGEQERKLLHLREYIYHRGQNIARNMNVKGHSF